MWEKFEKFCMNVGSVLARTVDAVECALSRKPDMQLHRAITNNFAWGVRLALRRGAKLRDDDYPHHSMIDTAIFHRKWDMARLLLELGADPNPHPENLDISLDVSDIPLLSALYAGQEKLAEAMLAKGANINGLRLGYLTETLLEHAARSRKPDVIRFLLRHGAAHESGSPTNRYVPLEDAVYGGHLDIATALMEGGVSPNTPFSGPRGKHMLNVVCQMGLTDFAKAAIAHGADLTPRDGAGNTPLHWAAYHNKAAMCESILAAGGPALAEETNALGNAPLHMAVNHPMLDPDFRTLDVLAERGADINARNRAGETPLMAAVRANWGLGVSSMLDLGSDLSIPDRGGKLPLDSTPTPAIKQLLLNHMEKAKTHPGISPSLRARLRNRQPVPSL